MAVSCSHPGEGRGNSGDISDGRHSDNGTRLAPVAWEPVRHVEARRAYMPSGRRRSRRKAAEPMITITSDMGHHQWSEKALRPWLLSRPAQKTPTAAISTAIDSLKRLTPKIVTPSAARRYE